MLAALVRSFLFTELYLAAAEALVTENAARLAIPYLVKVGIDSGIPPIRERDDLSTLLMVVGAVLLATLTQAVARNRFLVRQGVVGQDVLLALRRLQEQNEALQRENERLRAAGTATGAVPPTPPAGTGAEIARSDFGMSC